MDWPGDVQQNLRREVIRRVCLNSDDQEEYSMVLMRKLAVVPMLVGIKV